MRNDSLFRFGREKRTNATGCSVGVFVGDMLGVCEDSCRESTENSRQGLLLLLLLLIIIMVVCERPRPTPLYCVVLVGYRSTIVWSQFTFHLRIIYANLTGRNSLTR